jgi:tungstate transport system ATP-binding protein
MTVLQYQLDEVTRRYSSGFCLDVPRLAIERGETVCLLGPTGAGKSTLLRLLTGLEPPTTGRIAWCGEPLPAGGWPLATRRKIAAAAQQSVLLSGSVRYNVAFGLRIRGQRQQDGKVQQILESLNIGLLSEQSARTLSGGQTQLVALARALVIEPDVLLLDEPTAHLDPPHVALVESAIQEQQQRLGSTVVWATHNLFQARRVAARVALLLGGKLIEAGPTSRFFDQPADQRTADFIQGKMVY